MQLKKAAELRKKEQDIIFEKKMKKEIDKDAEQFEDKDAFVTPSYRKLLEERKAEEERLRKEEKAGLSSCCLQNPWFGVLKSYILYHFVWFNSHYSLRSEEGLESFLSKFAK